MQLFRFGLETYINDISGYGAKLYGGRWNNVGNAMLYTACSPSLAMLDFVCNASGIAKTVQTSLLTLKIDSKVKLHVKPETQNGTKVKLKGKGFPVYKKEGEFGDLIITYNLQIPTNLTDKEKELFTELSKLRNQS